MLEQDNVFGGATAFEELPALEGTSGSPDGLGAYAQPLPDAPRGQRHMTMQPMGSNVQGMDGAWDFIEPDDVSATSAMRSAGFTALFATVALGAGIAIGGPWGAGAGVLLAGATVNGYRAQKWWGSPDPSEKHEAVVSAVFAAFGVGLGGYMAYKAYGAKSK